MLVLALQFSRSHAASHRPPQWTVHASRGIDSLKTEEKTKSVAPNQGEQCLDLRWDD
jgi:hypothetical protein